ncbi:Tc toxin subunit A-related protein [Paenibacillus silvisoli]|uniref:Tc toxin subunit A-related protein n=1 Tax=Paenibacillus silvisoli TaxID=3110539 RepID=UPI00280567FD|nr:neuraminidase-like domain-containing protein [Paenibacillus silvisoli]
MNKFNFPSKISADVNAPSSKSIGDVQQVLQKLKLAIAPSDLARKEMGTTTAEAIRTFQKQTGLAETGTLTKDTVNKLNAELAHNFVAGNKTRTQRLQDMLKNVGGQIDPAEIASRQIGPSTEQALKQFQANSGILQDGRISEAVVAKLREESLKAAISAKPQVAQLHRTLLRALNTAKLGDVRVDHNELRGRAIGPTSKAAIKALQQKYGLPATGELDPDTYDRLLSLNASVPQPVSLVKPKKADEIQPIKRIARLNKKGQSINDVQSALAFLGYPIHEAEFKSRAFGKSTREAVVKYQRANGLPETGHVEGLTLDSLNREVSQAKPAGSVAESPPYRVRGSVRNELWTGMSGIKVQVWEKRISGQSTMLAERMTLPNGFFDVLYDPPRDAVSKQVKPSFSLEVKALDAGGHEVGSRLLVNPTMIAWANFTKGELPYRGTSEFEARMAAVTKAIGAQKVAELVETEQNRQISFAAQQVGLAAEDVMRLVLAHLVAAKLKQPAAGPEACYVYIGQNLPPGLPGDLLDAAEEWELIGQLVDSAANGIAFMERELQSSAFDNAVTLNLVPIATIRQKDAILNALASLQKTYALEKPLLVGNGSLQSLLNQSPQIKPHAGAVADAFLKFKSMGQEFWGYMKENAANFGGAKAVQDFETIVNVGYVTSNFEPMLTMLKKKIDDPGVLAINGARDLAALSTEEWVALIKESGGHVPPSPAGGAAPGDPLRAYAAALAGQSEQLFPAIALAAAVDRSPQSPLPRAKDVQALLVKHEELDLSATNLNVFFKEKGIADQELLAESLVMQRVHRIAPTAAAGMVLLDQNIHNSAQIVRLGKERLVELLTAKGAVDKRTALTVYGMAEQKYAQVLRRIGDYRFELHRANPRAIIDYTFTADDLPPEIKDIPDWETLFGSLDYCECSHCQSVYGPSAYLADVLRYLDSHGSETAGKTVKDILFERRPDIGNIKLNCENTDTPMPYIDLVCEVLEHAVPPVPDADFSLQTTRSPAELSAFPEHIRREAYDTLRTADYPVDGAFDLWQESSRLYLRHLGIARWELMERFRPLRDGGGIAISDASIAGEYFGMSTHEAKLITTKESANDKLTSYWGFDASLANISVAEFMRKSRLDYAQLLDLLAVRWINPSGDANPLVIERPNATCNTEEQKLVHLTVDRLDKLHRFLRLWRRTGWAMWELDLLLRSTAIGNGRIDLAALSALKSFKQVQERLMLTAERALVLYGNINTEERARPDAPQRKVESLYRQLFLVQAGANPLSAAFALPLTGAGHLSDNKAALLAAFALTETELTLLLAEIGGDALTLASLSTICRYVGLARGLRMNVKDILILKALTGKDLLAGAVVDVDLFASPKATLDFIEQVDWLAASGLAAGEIGYLLNHAPESPYGLRDEAVAQYIAGLRESLRANTSGRSDGTIIAHAANVFGLPYNQAGQLLEQVTLNGLALADHLHQSIAGLTERNDDGAYSAAITPADFPDLYGVYRQLHKIALLLTRLQVDAADLDWLLRNAARFGMLDLGSLPVNGAPAAPLFPAWRALYKWLYFKKQYPEPEAISLRQIFDMAADADTPAADFMAALAQLTQWAQQDLDDLATGLGIVHGADSDYARIDTYLRLWDCINKIKRIGAGAALLLAWANRDDAGSQFATAQQIRQAAKSKYEYGVWLDKATPLEKALREKKRTALASYLIERSQRTVGPEIKSGGKTYANPAYWHDANDLLKYYLIDVEMGADQPTSRIKQAMSSVQMFVQRCLLGLEKPVVEVSRAEQAETASGNSWSQWKWMKNYRIWEANRKVFLYPENWIEPELRDDKSPFFKELEEEIMQNDINDENVRSAFLNYVQKVHEVARLDIVGTYYELDDTNPSDHLPPDINVLHVIGRTRAHPAIYYYRRFDLNYGEWSAWEKIDVDIQSEQAIPVVYNRQLYLFWLSIVEKPQKVKKHPPAQPTNDTNVPEAPNQLEIQLSWSARKQTGWTAKRISKQKLIHPWQRPLFAYNLKPRYKSRENLLWLDVYITQTLEFNNTRFWDAYRNARDFVTSRRYDAAARPWHSSSFVFDGEVTDVKMKGLSGQYHVLDGSGLAADYLTQTTSFQYVQDNFGEEGRAVGRLTGPYEIAPRLPMPDGMHYHNTRLVNNKGPLNASQANVLESGHTRTLLNGAKSPFEIVFSQHQITFDTAERPVPFFYQDQSRAFFIRPEWRSIFFGFNGLNFSLRTYNYTCYPFYHPYTALFMRELKRSGVDGLLNRRIQQRPQDYYPGNGFDFGSYGPAWRTAPDKTAERDKVDFERYGAYSLYNWEIFFHIPMMIACKLNANQRFEEAMKWFHYMFDPTSADSPNVPQRYWITRPFFEQNSDDYRKQRIEALLQNIELHGDELTAWKNNPFKPHLIARYRPVAYQKAIVMKYIDNLIDWGDRLFRQDTIEAINEATTLYVLAYEILGRRPVKVPCVDREDRSYNELTADGGLDPFGNKKTDALMENFTGTPIQVIRTDEGAEPLPNLDIFYFGIPKNDVLLEYWNTVEDRLFKIRHGMNIDGVVRQLPLFEPEIDPALLVKAAAAGVDLSSVLSEVTAELGHYRFQRLAQKAVELCGEVRALGEKLLASLEKKDAEEMALLRSTHEVQLLQAVRDVRRKQIQEANETWAGLEQSKVMAEQKRDYYASRDFMNPWEITAMSLGGVSALAETGIALGYVLAGGLSVIPGFITGASGFGGSPHVVVDTDIGKNLAYQAENASKTLSSIASAADKLGSLASTVGSYQRRKDEWELQGRLAETEIAQLDKQIAASRIRVAIAEKEAENQELQIEQAETVLEYMRSKYTGKQLYDWHVRQVATLYFQSYQLAYDLAKRAEKCYRFEMGEPSAAFVQFGYWDSLKQGLLAGERLANDIRRMEASYLEQDTRDLEMTKHVSLAQMMPIKLIELKSSGACTVQVPEWLFDMDYPGHYRRRIKSVSVSIPCVAGPYTGVNCTLTLTNHGTRINDQLLGGYGNPLAAGDSRFYKSPVPVKAIATSHAQNDPGMFELSFSDERFLPFEGAGAVSEWRLEMPQENNRFDMSTVSDVILHIRYQAKASGNLALIQAAKDNAAATLPAEGARLFVLNHEMATAWQRFLHPTEDGGDQTLTIALGQEHLPFYARGKANINLTKVDLVVESRIVGNFELKLHVPGAAAAFDALMEPDAAYGNRQHLSKSGFAANAPLLGEWKFQLRKEGAADFKSLKPEDIRNAYLILGFKTS